MSARSIFELLGFQAVWWTCALGAAQGASWPGVLASAVFLAICLMVTAEPMRIARSVLLAGLIGLTAESLLLASGGVHYAAHWPAAMLAPAWIVALWLAFGASLDALARIMPSSLALTTLLGAISGPFAYLAGERLGALEIAAPRTPTLAALALVWAIATPLLLRFNGVWPQRAPAS